MKTLTIFATFLTGFLCTAAIAAPKTVPVDQTHYTGKWLEIGRRPMMITDGCVAGYTIYRRGPGADEVKVEDGCYKGEPGGALKTISGIGTIQDAGRSKLRVRYPYFITFNYWVLYKSPDKQWFISSDPNMYNLWIYSRTVPSKAKLRAMVQKAAELGYPVNVLEFPPQ